MKIDIVTLPYNVEGKDRGGASGPAGLLNAGIIEQLEKQGHTVATVRKVELSPDEAKQYGGWNRVGLSGGHLADLTAAARDRKSVV